jgi:hypothetical protein
MPESASNDRTVELEGNVYERLVAYNAADETLEDTLDRLFRVFVPHETHLRDIHPSPETVDGRVIVENWPDEDGVDQTHVFDSPVEAGEWYADAITATQPTGNWDGETDA